MPRIISTEPLEERGAHFGKIFIWGFGKDMGVGVVKADMLLSIEGKIRDDLRRRRMARRMASE
jgi:hypothetical protein